MPSPLRPSVIAGALLAAAGALPAMAQSVPTRTLAKPDAEYSEPFTSVSGVRELRDGRVIVIDSRDKIVEAVDLAKGTAEKIGREGSGPGEYALPTRLLALPGDSSAVMDPLNNRMLTVLPNAKAGGFIDLNSDAAGGRGGMMIRGASIAAADAGGRFYSAGSPIRMVNGNPQTSDSVAIERWDRRTGKRDTLAYLQLPKGSTQVSGSRGSMSIRIGGSNPFAAQDQWSAAPDGRVAVVHAADYHIDWYDANGRHVATPAIRFDRIKVSDDHKKEWREGLKTQTGLMITSNNGSRSAQSVPMTNVPEPTDWPEYMPPFLTNALSFSLDGTLWVKRTTAAGAPPTYDLIDGAGKLTQRVVLPKKSKLVGFGNGTVYVTRIDDDDLQYLQRYRFNPLERP